MSDLTISWGVYDDQKEVYNQFLEDIGEPVHVTLKRHLEIAHPDHSQTCSHFSDQGIYALQWLEKGEVTPLLS